MKTYLTIFYKTTETIDYAISNHKYKIKHSWPFYTAALTLTIQNFLNFTEFELKGFALIVIIVFGTLFVGFVGQYFWAFIIWGVGKLLNGQADREDIRIALNYALIPMLFYLLLLLIRLIVYPNSGYDYSQIGTFDYITSTIISLVSLRIFIICISRVQKLTYVLAAINILLPMVIVGLLRFAAGS